MAKSAKKFLSKKQVISMYEFLNNYLGKGYNESEILTHRDMCIYLEDKYGIYLQKVPFNKVDLEKVLTGEYVMVRDEFHKTKIYKNPMKSLSLLEDELNSKENKEFVRKKRFQTLNSLGLIETNTEVIDKNTIEEEDYDVESSNRQKQFVMNNRSYYRKRHY